MTPMLLQDAVNSWNDFGRPMLVGTIECLKEHGYIAWYVTKHGTGYGTTPLGRSSGLKPYAYIDKKMSQ